MSLLCPHCKKKAKYGLYRVKVKDKPVDVCDKCRDEIEEV